MRRCERLSVVPLQLKVVFHIFAKRMEFLPDLRFPSCRNTPSNDVKPTKPNYCHFYLIRRQRISVPIVSNFGIWNTVHIHFFCKIAT